MTTKLTFILGCVLILFGCGNRNSSDGSRFAGGILKGQDVAQESSLAKKVVLIAQNYEYKNDKPNFFGICTGVAIAPRTILTAAHCIEGGTTNVKILTSTNPRDHLRKKKDVFTPIYYRLHENYLPKKKLDLKLRSLPTAVEKSQALTRNADLALIYLDRSLEGEFEENPFRTDPNFPASASAEVTIAGFGKTTDLVDTSTINFDALNGILKEATINVHTPALRRRGFFVEQWESAGICSGDSGGPAFIKDVTGQLKITALAVNVFEMNNEQERKLDPKHEHNTCASHGLYLNITPYVDWIFKNINPPEPSEY